MVQFHDSYEYIMWIQAVSIKKNSLDPDHLPSLEARPSGSTLLQPRNYQVSKEVVHELEFGDIAVMQI